MKDIYKLLFIITLLLGNLAVAKCQSEIMLGINGTYNYPIGKFADKSPSGYGGSLEVINFAQHGFSQSFRLTFNQFVLDSAYVLKLNEQEDGTEVSGVSYVGGVVVAVNYYLRDDGFRPYLSMGFGHYENFIFTTVNGEAKDFRRSDFGFSPGIGAVIPLGQFVRFHINTTLQTILDGEIHEPNSWFVSGNAGFIFSFKK